jgi:hypothetical protein
VRTVLPKARQTRALLQPAPTFYRRGCEPVNDALGRTAHVRHDEADAGIRFSGTPLDLRDNPPRLGPASHPAATRNSMVYWAAETSSRAGSSLSNYIGNVESGYQGNRAAVCRITCMGFDAAAARAGATSTGAGSPDGRTNETAAATGATAGTKKSTRACREEWRANQTALRANGMTEKVYVAECQGAAGNASAQNPASPDSQTNPASATLPHATAGETLKVKACVEEWRTKRRTKRAADELRGLTEKAYIEQCLSGSTPPAPSSGAASPR